MLKNVKHFTNNIKLCITMQLNRIKVVLAERQRTSRWLATAIDKNETTVSRWCSNKSQPSAEVFAKIAIALDVDIRELFNSTKENFRSADE